VSLVERAIELHAASYPDDGSHWDGWHDLTSAERSVWLERAKVERLEAENRDLRATVERYRAVRV
jgi:hypothetical protein